MPAPAVTRRASAALMASAASLTFSSMVVSIVQPLPQHFLYFLPLPHGQGSLRPILGCWMVAGATDGAGGAGGAGTAKGARRVGVTCGLRGR